MKSYQEIVTDKIINRMQKNSKKNPVFDIDIEKYKLNYYALKDKKIYVDFNYLSEITCSTVYEIITGQVGFDFSALKYENSVVDSILSDKSFKIVLYSKDNDLYDSSDFKTHDYSVILYSDKKDIVLQIRSKKSGIFVSYCSGNIANIEKFVKEQSQFLYKETKCEIAIFYQENGRTDIRKISIDPVEVDVELNYGKDFALKHQIIVDKMENKKSGLYVFHGPPSGGKTSYIKYLSQEVNRMFIFIPSGLVQSIDSPALVSILLNYENPVLILEDAEKAVQSRKDNPNSSIVSSLLNLSDGILSSMLGVSLIVTFNVGRENIDEALVRKGRLMVEHEFGKLTAAEANLVAKKIGKKITFKEPQMLGDIYNYEEDNFHKEKENVTFGFAQAV